MEARGQAEAEVKLACTVVRIVMSSQLNLIYECSFILLGVAQNFCVFL